MVQRAVTMPHQLARRFDHGSVELAMRIDANLLVKNGLGDYQVASWGGGSHADL
jgi:hypothetical protein